ncbi:unnamed protein product [Calicophoron daubneyi]|uniref:Uncharacterized protein n=1 Tax=Calicophoron daubneyi TaxID=300641 RepID=A0AAV2TKF1_CALDB
MYIVATLPQHEDEIVLLSSTWVTDERSDRGLPVTQMPSLRPEKLYQAAKNHTPCQLGDKKYTFKEYGRTIRFSYARQMEFQLSEGSALSSDCTVQMGFSPKRKIRTVSLEEETYKEPQKTVPCPASAQHW